MRGPRGIVKAIGLAWHRDQILLVFGVEGQKGWAPDSEPSEGPGVVDDSIHDFRERHT